MTTEEQPVPDGPPRSPARPAAGPRTAALVVGLIAGSGGLLAWLSPFTWANHATLLSWWSVALISIAAEVLVFHLEFRRERYTFTLSELPLVLGLFFAGPLYLVGGRLLGELVFLVVKERQPLRKVVVNLASFSSECAVLLTVFHLIGAGGSVRRPIVWLAALASVAAADLVGYCVVGLVVRWHGAPVDLRSIVVAGLLTAPVNTSFALTVGILLTVAPWATLLLSGVAVFLFLSYRSYAALSQRYSSLSLLYDFTRLVSGSKSPDAVLEAILTQSKDLVRADRAEIWLADGDHYVGLRVDDDGLSSVQLPADTSRLVATWLVSNADGSAALVPAIGQNEEQAAIAAAFGAEECIIGPVTEGGTVVGIIAVVDRLGELAHFEAEDVRLFATLANHASVALENGRLIDRLHDEATQREHEAHHDALTGLPNRVLFGARLRAGLAEVERSGERLAIAVMDLDGFKEINDTLGHQWGDEVLVEVARRLTRIVRAPATVARLGGDEFAVLFPGAGSVEDVEAIGRRIRSAIAEPLTIAELRLEVGISIGLALSPDDGMDATMLLQRADIAMYGAKAGAGGGVNRYRVEDDQNTPRRLAMANDLREAIERSELMMVYQPKVRLSDGVVIGYEALVRWRHPTLGMVFPDEFIPLAERTGIITNLTAFVLRTSLHQARQWQAEGHAWGVSVNLSMRNLLDNELALSVQTLLEETGLDPKTVTLEMTETNVMADAARSITVLRELSSLGVRLSIDDFGTGYSSLAYLQRLPVQEVKIDKSFVLPMTEDSNAEALVRSILDLGHNLGLEVVAEGVEDRAALDRLRALGCDEVQGYFLGRPMPAADLDHWYLTHLAQPVVPNIRLSA